VGGIMDKQKILAAIKAYKGALEAGRSKEAPYPEEDFYSAGIAALSNVLELLEGKIDKTEYEEYLADISFEKTLPYPELTAPLESAREYLDSNAEKTLKK